MKRTILAAAPLLLLCSCLATQAAVEKANGAAVAAQAAADKAMARANSPDVTQAELDDAITEAVAAAEAAMDAAKAIPEAISTDLDNVKKGVTGFGGMGDGGLVGLGLTAAAWFMRDRRKKLGLDPLQRSDKPTPPTTT